MSLRRELSEYGFTVAWRCPRMGAGEGCGCYALSGHDGAVVVRTGVTSFYSGPAEMGGNPARLMEIDGWCERPLEEGELPSFLSSEMLLFRIDAPNRARMKIHYKHGPT